MAKRGCVVSSRTKPLVLMIYEMPDDAPEEVILTFAPPVMVTLLLNVSCNVPLRVVPVVIGAWSWMPWTERVPPGVTVPTVAFRALVVTPAGVIVIPGRAI